MHGCFELRLKGTAIFGDGLFQLLLKGDRPGVSSNDVGGNSADERQRLIGLIDREMTARTRRTDGSRRKKLGTRHDGIPPF